MIAFLENAYQGYKDSDPQIIYQPLPAKMDPWCYDHGRLIDVANAELSNGWAINPSWEPNDSTGTRANYSNVPMLISETAGSSLSFDFWGNAVGIAVVCRCRRLVYVARINWIYASVLRKTSGVRGTPVVYGIFL